MFEKVCNLFFGLELLLSSQVFQELLIFVLRILQLLGLFAIILIRLVHLR